MLLYSILATGDFAFIKKVMIFDMHLYSSLGGKFRGKRGGFCFFVILRENMEVKTTWCAIRADAGLSEKATKRRNVTLNPSSAM